MKTLRKEIIEVKNVEYIPLAIDMKQGVLYYSEKFKTAGHLCLCGCNMPVFTPVNKNPNTYKSDFWNLSVNNKGVTMTPSLFHRIGCKSHYIITNGVANFV